MIDDKTLAFLCAGAYLPTPTLEVGSDLAVNLTEAGDDVVVAFRGTANVVGWLRDLDVLPKPHELIGYCHHGFLTGATALWQRLDLPTNRRIVLVGHSLGGALAAVLGALRIAAGDRVDELVTFGAPRPGYNTLGAVYGDLPVRQYVHGDDPVTRVPFDLRAFPYKHVRDPLIRIGTPSRENWRDHSIVGYQTALK